MFYLDTLLRTIAWETVTLVAFRNYSKEARLESEYTDDFAWKKEKKKNDMQLNIKRLLLITHKKRDLT